MKRMETITNESLLTDILGHKPSRGEILNILKKVKDSGMSVIEAAQKEGYLEFLQEQDGKLSQVCSRVQYGSIEDYRKAHPYRKVVILSTPDNKSNKNTEENGSK